MVDDAQHRRHLLVESGADDLGAGVDAHGLAVAGHAEGDGAVVGEDGDAGPQRRGETTNICVVDPAGNACVVTTTLGVGAGVWLPGLGVHLNSMLGEGELLSAESGPGQRMSSMMCPLVVTEGNTLALAAGAAGASRIRTALLHTLVGVLLDELDATTAIARGLKKRSRSVRMLDEVLRGTASVL